MVSACLDGLVGRGQEVLSNSRNYKIIIRKSNAGLVCQDAGALLLGRLRRRVIGLYVETKVWLAMRTKGGWKCILRGFFQRDRHTFFLRFGGRDGEESSGRSLASLRSSRRVLCDRLDEGGIARAP